MDSVAPIGGKSSKDDFKSFQDNLFKYLQSRNSTLSDYVAQLLSSVELSLTPLPSSCGSVSSNYEINLDDITNLLPSQSNQIQDKDSLAYYQEVVLNYAPFLQHVSILLHEVPPTAFVSANAGYTVWTCVNQEELVYCLTDAQSSHQAVQYSACLRLTAILERSLQDLIWTIDGNTPIILKDVLRSNVLTEVLSKDILTLLDVIIGPPASLNIRNLVWHGFGSANEHPEHFALVVYFTLIMIGGELNHKSIEISHRPYVLLDTSLLASQHSQLLEHTADTEFVSLLQIIETKSKEMEQALKYAAEGKYGQATALMVTSFEHIARVAFCIYNSCPERSMTALCSEYFTTLDHVFEESSSDNLSSDAVPNILYTVLPDRLRTALSDLLYYPRGLRLRDRMSHLEIFYQGFTKDIWSYCYNILSVVILYIVNGKCNSTVADYLINDYEPLYHPLACTVRLSHKLKKELKDLQDIIAPPEIDITVLADDLHDMHIQQLQVCFLQTHCDRTKSLHLSTSNTLFQKDCDTATNISTSSGFRIVSEWCHLIHAICENVLATVIVMRDYNKDRQEMLKKRTLRGRQRKNLAVFYGHRHFLGKLLSTLYSLSVGLIQAVGNSNNCVVQKKHKALLQLAENLASLVRENKWTNAVQYFVEFTKTHLNTSI